MKDYITKLTEHALGVSPTARPVIPSMYAQGPVMRTGPMVNELSLAAEWRESGGLANEPPVANQRREETAATIAQSSPRQADSPLQDGLRIRDVMRSSVAASEPRPTRQGDGRATVKPDQADDLPTTTRLAAEASTIRPRASEPNADRPESASTRIRANQSAVEPSDESRQTHGNESRHTSVDESATQRRRSVTTHVRPAVAETIAPKPIIAQARQNLSSNETSSTDNQSPIVPPTIRVTIGRVEVRAVMPPAPQAKPRAMHAPKLSLDDYLRTRNGGKR